MEQDPEAFREKEAVGRQERRIKEMTEDPVKYRLKEKTRKATYRLSLVDTSFKRKKLFLASIRNGRIFVCLSCHRKLHENQVIELDENWREDYELKFPNSLAKLIGPPPERMVYLPCPRQEPSRHVSENFICYTCKKYLERNAMAPMSYQNNLQLVNINKYPELKLSDLEQQLIALNILFQKIVLLPKSRWNAMKDKTVSVPVETTDVMDTLIKLPRTPADAHLAVVQLKRRLNFQEFTLSSLSTSAM